MTDKLDIRRLLSAKILEASTNVARFNEEEIKSELVIKQLVALNKNLQEVLETFSEEEKAMYEEEMDNIENTHPADRVDQLMNGTSVEDINQKIQNARINTLNTIGEFIDPFTIKRNLFKD